MHQWIITQHQNMVEKHEKFDDRDAFEPIKITCAVDNDYIKKLNQLMVKSTWL